MRFRDKMLRRFSGAGMLLAGLLLSGAVQAQQVDDARAGRIVFEENCAACHQADAGGKPGLAPSLINKEFLAAASDRFLKATILEGRGDTQMMPFKEVLNERQVNAVIAFLRSHISIPSRGMMVDEDRQAMGDPRLGKRWFAQVCAGCHGPRGEGYAGEGSGTAIGKKGFLSKASDGYIRYIIKNGRSNTPMRSFSGPEALANLNDREIDDIISYLRILE